MAQGQSVWPCRRSVGGRQSSVKRTLPANVLPASPSAAPCAAFPFLPNRRWFLMSRKKRQRSRRLMVLDTNVLMHDPSCLLRFHEHDVFIPMIVLEELDNNKRGQSEVSRNARQASRTMEVLVHGAPHLEIDQGFPLPKLSDSHPFCGRLFFQSRTLNY